MRAAALLLAVAACSAGSPGPGIDVDRPPPPLAIWISITSLPVAATGAWLSRSRTPAGPLGTVVLVVGSALAILVGAAMLIRHEAPCTSSQFQEIHLACEASANVH